MTDAISEGMLFDIGYADGITPALAVLNGTPAGQCGMLFRRLRY
jgi:hypothetical protein